MIEECSTSLSLQWEGSDHGLASQDSIAAPILHTKYNALVHRAQQLRLAKVCVCVCVYMFVSDVGRGMHSKSVCVCVWGGGGYIPSYVSPPPSPTSSVWTSSARL